MKQKKLTVLINDNLYQVFLFSSACTIPISFATHSWFVISKKGELSRWEILMIPRGNETSWKHLHLNFFPTTSGINILPFTKHKWTGKLLGYVEGNSKSYVKRMVELIESSPEKYSFNNRYSLLGPNSNSYIQWVLNQFPESKLKLPINSFGKGYKFK